MSKNIDYDLLYASKLVAKISASILAGSCLYSQFVDIPAKMESGSKIAAMLFEPSNRKSTILTGLFASTGFLGALSAYAIKPDNKWLAAGLLSLSVIPFKYFVMGSTTKSLLSPTLQKDSDTASLLLEKWNRMDGFKALLSLLPMLLMEIE